MKVYFFLINERHIPKRIKYTFALANKFSIDGEKYQIYAFTFKKKHRDEFIKTRSSKFILREQEITDEEVLKLMEESKSIQLKRIEYKNYGYSVKLLSTDTEHNTCKYDWTCFFEDNPEKYFSFITESIINSYKDEYRDALVALGLNGLIYSMDERTYSLLEDFITMEDSELIQIKPQTIWDESIGKAVDISVSISSKEFNMFAALFGKLLKG